MYLVEKGIPESTILAYGRTILKAKIIIWNSLSIIHFVSSGETNPELKIGMFFHGEELSWRRREEQEKRGSELALDTRKRRGRGET